MKNYLPGRSDDHVWIEELGGWIDIQTASDADSDYYMTKDQANQWIERYNSEQPRYRAYLVEM